MGTLGLMLKNWYKKSKAFTIQWKSQMQHFQHTLVDIEIKEMGKLKKKTQKWRSATAENIQGKKSHDNCKARLKELSKAKF